MNLFDPKRRAESAPKVECPKCHKEFTLGVNGTTDGCDVCTGTVRAANGYVLYQPICSGLDPVHCDDVNCQVHGKGKQ